MKLSFNKKPVTETNQLYLFKTEFKNGDYIYWDGYFPAHDSDPTIHFYQPRFGIIKDSNPGEYAGKDAIYIETITEEMFFVYPESLSPAELVKIFDKYKLQKGESISVDEVSYYIIYSIEFKPNYVFINGFLKLYDYYFSNGEIYKMVRI